MAHHTHQPAPAALRGRRHGGFTLIELMASIAMALLLILGVQQVFKAASTGVGAGQALSTIGRDSRSAQAVFYADLKSAVMPPSSTGGIMDDGPAFVIRSERMYAFRTAADRLGDVDGNSATWDLNGDNDEVDAHEVITPPILNTRSHRLDKLIFFGRGAFTRQTGGTVASGGAAPYIADQSSAEAMVWYGHLLLPDFTTTDAGKRHEYVHRAPGEGTPTNNRDNLYSTQWMLGRLQFLLTKGLTQELDGRALTVGDRTQPTPVPQVFFPRRSMMADTSSIAPFDVDNLSSEAQAAARWEFSSARYDVLGVSMGMASEIFAQHVAPSADPQWYELLSNYRFQANPFPAKPLDASDVARTAPIFLRSCSQFVVEYAGDFVTQDLDPASATFGHVSASDPTDPDGAIDFVVRWNDADGDGIIDATENVGVRRDTRWYGLPRDTDGDGVIPGFITGRNANQMRDVVPLRDVIKTGAGAGYGGMAFERFRASPSPLELPTVADYAAVGGMVPGATYLCAWGDGTGSAAKPRMIRITLALDDPAGNIADEQVFEYVIDLP
jgi:hypothetical protein